jgi:glycosyltransferase involved in cell wall biosynthesis
MIADGGNCLFSIVVPVYRQWHLVPKLLSSLDRQTLPRSLFEVILVDNGSPDAPPLAPGGTALLRCAEPGSYPARNVGAAAARGKWLVFTDADCVAAPRWLEALRDAAEAGPGRMLAGAVRMVASSERPGPSEIYDIVKGIPQERYVRRGYGATANLAVPRAVFERLGGFEQSRLSGGDAEFCRRAGLPVILVGQAVVEHPARTSWDQIATKARRIRGGQMMRNTHWRNRSILGTLISTAYGAWFFLTDRRHTLWRRLVASAVLLRLCGVEVAEFVRLKVRGGTGERL